MQKNKKKIIISAVDAFRMKKKKVTVGVTAFTSVHRVLYSIYIMTPKVGVQM